MSFIDNSCLGIILWDGVYYIDYFRNDKMRFYIWYIWNLNLIIINSKIVNLKNGCDSLCVN